MHLPIWSSCFISFPTCGKYIHVNACFLQRIPFTLLSLSLSRLAAVFLVFHKFWCSKEISQLNFISNIKNIECERCFPQIFRCVLNSLVRRWRRRRRSFIHRRRQRRGKTFSYCNDFSFFRTHFHTCCFWFLCVMFLVRNNRTTPMGFARI